MRLSGNWVQSFFAQKWTKIFKKCWHFPKNVCFFKKSFHFLRVFFQAAFPWVSPDKMEAGGKPFGLFLGVGPSIAPSPWKFFCRRPCSQSSNYCSHTAEVALLILTNVL